MAEKVKVILSHNQFLTVAVVIVAVLMVWLFGCESTTQSPLRPETKVTRAELEVEVDMFKIKVQQSVKDLDRQDLFKQELFNIGVLFAQGGSVNPVGAGITLLSILGVGACADNVRKNTVIKTKDNALKALQAKVTITTGNEDAEDTTTV